MDFSLDGLEVSKSDFYYTPHLVPHPLHQEISL